MSAAVRYSPVSHDSSSEDDRSFTDSEKHAEHDHRPPRSILDRKLLRYLLITQAIFSIFALAIFTFKIAFGGYSSHSKLPTPQLPIEQVVFQKHSEFSSPPTPENNALWMDLLGPGMGFVSVQNPEQYGLPRGIVNRLTPPDVQVFGISMYHQLHCLLMIRDIYWEKQDSKRSAHTMEFEGMGPGPDDMDHISHCFDYLRQAIMCAGDMSMESPAIEKSKDGMNHINGWDSSHVCRSYQASRDWMDLSIPPGV